MRFSIPRASTALFVVLSLITGTAQPAYSDRPADDPVLSALLEAPVSAAARPIAEEEEWVEDWIEDPDLPGFYTNDEEKKLLLRLKVGKFGKFNVLIDGCTGEAEIKKTLYGVTLTYRFVKEGNNWFLKDYFDNNLCSITRDADGSVTFTCRTDSYHISFDPETGKVCYSFGDSTFCEHLPKELQRFLEKLKNFYWCPYLTPAPAEGSQPGENEPPDDGWDTPMCMGLARQVELDGGAPLGTSPMGEEIVRGSHGGVPGP